MDVEEAVKQINQRRLDNKDKWYVWAGTIEEHTHVRLKAYNTWIQRLEVRHHNNVTPSIVTGNEGDRPVSDFKAWLRNVLNRATERAPTPEVEPKSD